MLSTESCKRKGWILVHRHGRKYSFKEFTDVGEMETELSSRQPIDWYWKTSKRMNEGGPYTVLFGFDGQVWGHATAHVIHKIGKKMEKDFNFAFRLSQIYLLRKYGKRPVPYKDIMHDKRISRHRGLIRVEPNMCREYLHILSS